MERILKVVARILFALLAVLTVSAGWLLRPMGSSELISRPAPAADYRTATARIAAIAAEEAKLELQSAGTSMALLHGREAGTAVVIFHGYTDVPAQFSAVARGFYEFGANVWVPRMPYHGYKDRMTGDISRITADLLRRTADANVDIAAGLGRKVEVVGLSGGGAMAAWAAAERPDVARTVILSPLMLPKGYEPWMVRPLARLVAMLPDAFTWWSDKKAAGPGPEYPRYSRHGIAAYLMLAERAKADGAGGRRPVAGDVVMVCNRNDKHIDTQYPIDVMKSLVRDTATLRIITIPAAEGLPHDIVGLTGRNRPQAYRYLSEAFRVPLPDPPAERTAATDIVGR